MEKARFSKREMMTVFCELIKNHKYFRNFPVYLNRNNTIVIRVADVGTSTNCYSWENERYGIQYQIGYNIERNGFWIRRRNGGSIFRHHLDRDTHEYNFSNYEDVYNYFIKFWEKYKLA